MLKAKPTDKHVTFSGIKSDPIQDSKDNDESKWGIGESLSIDDIGPISPKSSEGYSSFFYAKDLGSNKVFTYMAEECDSNTYLEVIEKIRLYFNGKGHILKTIRSDFKNIYRTPEVNAYKVSNNIEHQSSSPYHQWQNTVERDIQTMLNNVSANIYGQLLLRADSWPSQ